MLACWFFLFCTQIEAGVTRFDSAYFFQSEEALKEKQVDFKDLARYSRQVQSAAWKVLKEAKLAPNKGYIVLAVRSDQEIAVWFDMDVTLHEYYVYEINEAVKKIRPFHIDKGIVVFALKMSIETAQHTQKPFPAPVEWKAAKLKLADPEDIEQLVLSIWPE